MLNIVMGDVQGKVVWCGDFNAHSTLWGSDRTDANGLIIEEYIEDKGLVCINDGRGTRYDCVRNKESVIDLTMTSNEMAGITAWEVLKKTLMGSDHYPIVTKIGVELQREEDMRMPRWKIDKANWGLFRELSNKRFEQLHKEEWTNVDEFNERVVTAVIKSANESIPKSSGCRSKKNMPWWDEDCRQAIKVRNRAFRLLKKHHTMELLLVQYKRSQAVVRRTVRAAKRACWRQYCNEIGREVRLSDIWGMIRKMSGIRRSTTIPILTSNCKTAVSGSEKAVLLAETLTRVHSSENLSAKAKQQRSTILTQNTWVNKKKTNNGGESGSSIQYV